MTTASSHGNTGGGPDNRSSAGVEARRTRVLHIVQNLNYGGMERLIAEMVGGLEPARFESHVLVLEYLGRFARGLEEHAVLHQAHPLPRSSLLWPGGLARQIRGIRPDVVHTHSGVWYKGSLAARIGGVSRVIHTEHGRPVRDPWQARLIDRLASARTDRIAAVSDATAHTLAGIVRHPDRIRVVLNGVDSRTYRPRPDLGTMRAELGLSADTAVIGSIGRLEEIKGFDVAVEAAAILRRGWHGSDPCPVLVLAGDGSQRPELQARIQRHGLSEVVRILGWRDDVHDLLASFTLFTMPSRSEGTSVSLLEAMSSGLAPVVTDVGGSPSVLGPGLRHRLVPPQDAAALAAAWEDALCDRERLAEDAAAARKRVLERFSLDAMLGRYASLYLGEDDAIGQRSRAPEPSAERPAGSEEALRQGERQRAMGSPLSFQKESGRWM